MADNVTLPASTGTFDARSNDKGGKQIQVINIDVGDDTTESIVGPTVPLPVALDNASLAALETTELGATSLAALESITANVAGVATEAKQDTLIGHVNGVEGALAVLATETTLATIAGAIKAEDSAHVSGHTGIPMLGIRQVADTPSTDTDGDYTLAKFDEEGRLKVASKSASFEVVTGALTTAGTTLVCDTRRASNVTFHVKNTGSVTLAAGTFIFEASVDSTNGTDGTWFGMQAGRTNANTAELQIALSGIAAGAGNATAWEASVNAYDWFRIRCSVNVTASAAATWTIKRGTYATEPIPIAQVTATQPVSGSVTVTAGTVNPVVPATPYFVNSAASTNGALILTGTSGLQSFYATNTGASVAYVKLYNKATAPTVGTDIPEMIIPVPAAASGVPGVATLPIGFSGFRFALGLGIAITGAAADNDTTAVTAGQVRVKLSRTI